MRGAALWNRLNDSALPSGGACLWNRSKDAALPSGSLACAA